MIVLVMIISGCLIMAFCILIGFLLGKYFGIALVEKKVLDAIQKQPSNELLRFGDRLFKVKKSPFHE